MVACGVGLTLVLWARTATAQSFRWDSGHPPRSVVVEYEGTELEVAELDATLRELMGRLGLQLVAAGERAPGAVVAYARVGIEHDRAHVRVTEGETRGAPPVQRTLVRNESSALFRETVAHVLLGLVESLLERDHEAREPEAPTRDADEPRQHARPRPARTYALGVHGGPALLGVAQWGARFVATGALAFDRALHPSVALDLGATWPARLKAQGIAATFVLTSARFRARMDPIRRRRGSLEVSLGGGIDIASLKPASAPGTLLLERTSVRVQPVFGGALSGRLPLSAKLSAVASLGVDIDVARRKWWVQEGTTQAVIFETAVLRPYAFLGIDWTVGGHP